MNPYLCLKIRCNRKIRKKTLNVIKFKEADLRQLISSSNKRDRKPGRGNCLTSERKNESMFSAHNIGQSKSQYSTHIFIKIL